MGFEKYFRGWKLGLGNVTDPVHYVGDSEMLEKNVSQSDQETTIVWKGHETLGSDFTVIAVWRNIGGRYEAEIRHENYQGEEFVEEIVFPVLEFDFSEDSDFVYGQDMGCRLNGKTFFPPGSQRSIGFNSVQFCALIDAGCGYYVDYRDSSGNAKHATIEISEDGKKFIYASVCPQNLGDAPAASGSIPYVTSVKEFTGSWFDAALIYREWALQQPWHCNRVAENPLRDIGMWIWNRGLIEDVIPPIEQLQKALPEVPLALDWYWWHHNPYDTGYPDFWPPREGVEQFRQTVEHLTGQGIFTQVYINGVCWDLDGPTWDEGGDESIVVGRDGKPQAHAFNRYNQHRLGFMCGEAPKFQDKISALVKRLADSGLSGLYLDMIGGASTSMCYHPSHQHGRGGGNYCVKGYREMLQRLKEENPGFPLSTEYANEAFMDLFDGAIVCNSVSNEHLNHNAEAEVIPLFTAVYHGRFALFGNYACPDGITPWDPLWPSEDRWKNEKKWHELYRDQFFVEMARPVIWGVQPMVCNLKQEIMDNPGFEEIYAFIRHTAEFYYQNRNFLFDGEMLSPEGFSCVPREVQFMARMIFTKEDECRIITKIMPSLLHSCWQSEDGNRQALFLANYTAEAQEWSFRDLQGSIAARSYQKINMGAFAECAARGGLASH